jgi:hypothetical protein
VRKYTADQNSLPWLNRQLLKLRRPKGVFVMPPVCLDTSVRKNKYLSREKRRIFLLRENLFLSNKLYRRSNAPFGQMWEREEATF